MLVTTWFKREPEININDIVLVRDENTPVCRWPLARVIEKHPGRDGLTRVVTLKTENNILKRPITKISPLPIDNANTNIATVKKHRQAQRKTNVLPIIIAMMSIMTTINGNNIAHQSANLQCSIQQFEKQYVYFDKESTIHFSNTNWNIVAFFDLKIFEIELKSIRSNIKMLHSTCSGIANYESSCNELVQLLQNQLDDIHEKHEMIFKQELDKRITKRAALDIIGNIASDLFGVLDSRFAREYAQDMGKLMNNDEHLVELIQNQTSIIDSTLNIVKNNENEIYRQNGIINQLIKTIKEIKNGEWAFQRLSTTTAQLSHVLTKYEHQQTNMIDVMTNVNQNNIAAYIMTPKQWKRQLGIIRANVKTLSVPEANIYGTAKVKAFQSSNNIIFKISIPLINDSSYHLFRIIPIPIYRNGASGMITINNTHIAVEENRQLYRFMTIENIKKCIIYTTESIICSRGNHMLTARSESCEWNILNKLSYDECTFRATKNDNWFMELHAHNKWLFSVKDEQLMNLICNQQIQVVRLHGEGMITINENCVLNNEFRRIVAHNELLSNRNESILIHVNVSDIDFAPMKIFGEPEIELEHLNSNISSIKHQIEILKGQSKLPEYVNKHDMHQYILLYGVIIVGIGIWTYYKCKSKKIKANSKLSKNPKESPIPAPRVITRAISMPTI